MAEILRHCLENTPAETGNRITFNGFGASGYGSREVSQAMKTLQRALLLHLVYPTGEVEPPPVTNVRKSHKLFFVDSGLLASALNVQWSEMGSEDLNASFRGVLAEQAIAQSLLSLHNHAVPKLQFWARNKRGSSAEVDFVVQHSGKLIPIEVRLPDSCEVLGAVLSDQVKSLDWRARNAEIVCSVSDEIVSEVLHRIVDLLTEQSISPYLRDQILSEQKVIYEEAG
ncbi:MAG: DUF4143 domain-containing protein [Candidatus Aegiribacteria sp.]|nr:DUF4143 domain-containing protein [Candidatus Aegiribacteria sp.]